MEILHGLITFLVVKLSSSTTVQAQGVVGGSATLECPIISTNTYHWQLSINTFWGSTFTNITNQYENANTRSLTIRHLSFNDGGNYRCTLVNGQQGFVYLTVSECSSVNTCSQWTAWTSCSTTCGGGFESRNRYQCSSNCSDSSYSTRYCNYMFYPEVNGNWGTWSAWTNCTVTCGGGTRTRYRDCNDPSPSNCGNDCPGANSESQDCSTEECPDIETSSLPVGGVIAGILSAFVVILTLAVLAIILIRRRTQKYSETSYCVSAVRQEDEHFYIQTRPKNEYDNTDQHISDQIESNRDLLMEYDSPTFSKFLLDKHLYAKTLKEEFERLTKSRPREHGTDYEEVNVAFESESGMTYEAYVNKAVVKKHTTNKITVITETPTNHTMEMFWTLANKLTIHDIILLVQRKEKIFDFFPMTDEPMETHNLEVKMISSGRQHDGIYLYSLELFDRDSQNVSETRLFKTTNWKTEDAFPDISTLCTLITAPNESSEGVVMIGSKGNGYRICGVLSVCLDVMYAIRDDKKFSILKIALDLVKTRPDLFQTFEEYELCYNILRRYLENEHCYAVIY